MNVKFCDSEYVKNNTSVEKNVDNNLINIHILTASNIDVKLCLGQTYYDHLVQAKIDGTLTNEEDILIDSYIKPFVAHKTHYYLFPHIYVSTSNNGLQEGSATNSASTSFNTYKSIRNNVENIADAYLIRLENELKDNCSNKYPLAVSKFGDNPQANRMTNKMGIYLGKY